MFFSGGLPKGTAQAVRDTTQATLSTGPEFVNQFLNIGKSDSFGIELEGTWVVNDNFNIEGSLGYVDSEFKDFATNNLTRAVGNSDASGNTSERFPELQGSLSFQYTDALVDGWDWYVRSDNSYLDTRYASEVNLAEADTTFLMNLRLGARSDNLRVELYVTNLTDEDTPVAAVRSTDLGGTFTRTNGARPFDFLLGLRDHREWGLRVTGKY